MTRPNDLKRNGAMPGKGRDKEGKDARAVRYEGGRDAIMMTLVLSVLQMSKSLTDLHFLHTHRPRPRMPSRNCNSLDKIRFMLPKNNAWAGGRE